MRRKDKKFIRGDAEKMSEKNWRQPAEDIAG
jgi:hypothetical protein